MESCQCLEQNFKTGWPLRSKGAADVASVIINKLFEFGLVDKVITDQGKDCVYETSTKYTPYFSLFYRHPKLPEVLNSSSIGDVICDPAKDIDEKIERVKALQAELLGNTEKAEGNRRKAFESQRGNVKSFNIHKGEEVQKKEGRCFAKIFIYSNLRSSNCTALYDHCYCDKSQSEAEIDDLKEDPDNSPGLDP
ncbi:hypothetical protein AAFF_G00118490 [Aldrovandia affinis]|uniref:Uncharacterized protein n=1 Tax=Aldrovandia affinis TaxID=143900 RepID=A0AAD7RSP7_9TELE|nr:hypothetical protein AAFF_G00118490 [Aldrovandia affinis]